MSMLEMARQAYEGVETYERAIAAELDKKPRTTKQHVWQQHHISNLVERIQVSPKEGRVPVSFSLLIPLACHSCAHLVWLLGAEPPDQRASARGR